MEWEARDWDLAAWMGSSLAATRVSTLAQEIRTPRLLPVVEAFKHNASDAVFLSEVPGRMFMAGQVFKLAQTAARMKVTGGDPCLGGFQSRFPQGPWEEIEKESKALFETTSRLLKGEEQAPFPINDNGTSPKDIAQSVDPAVWASFDTLKFLQIVLCWTAFETLAGDLWEAAVNEHPQQLAEMRSSNAKQNEAKSLPTSYLERHRYDVRDKMGTILREHRCKFTKLEEIAAAYRLAFPPGSDPGSEERWKDADLRACSAVRNVIVHKAGVVDADFIRSRGTDSRLATSDMGSTIKLSGELVQGLSHGVIRFGAELIVAVDRWLIAN